MRISLVVAPNSVNNAPLCIKAAIIRYFTSAYYVDSNGKPQGFAIDAIT
ncbi:hypothetical protein [Aphanothece sacrum]|uniref:Two-component sensor histidine kinase n=1 Tax=Aphanothece sacrum FPU1 TaxID=1920663 RepID=A0A401IC52_APHSA|nr:hypothetical protein [Aphanothece sacrum]GBF78806.1 two-component sensor histidine kinase [Aphanothece sacrum FPU1]